MATLMAASNHNFTAASWGTVDATALLVSNTNNTGITSTYQLSSTFTPGAITVDGIAIWVNTRAASPSGTISVALDQATVTVVGTEVTINVSDVPSDGNCWVFFKFAAPVLLAAATAYSVKIKTSAASGQLNCFRNSAAGTNWSRLLRTTTLAAPGASDNLYVIGEKTGAGTGNTITVTMDNIATTTWGLVDISSGGFLINGIAAATAYRLKMGGNLNIRSGGEVNIGTTSARIPSDSSAEWDFANAVNVDLGIIITGNGILKTGGNNNANPWALLAADASAAATSLTTDRSTGWKNGDTIAIASTTRTASECESKALSADASGTTLTIAAITNAHGGNLSSLVTAELANLTRNVKIHGASVTLQAYISVGTNTTCDWNDTEFSFMGSNTSGKRGINVSTTTGTFSANYCSFHDFTVANSIGLFADQSAGSGITISHCVFYLCGLHCLHVANVTTTNGVTINDVVCIRTTGGTGWGAVISFNLSVTDLRSVGSVDSGILVGAAPGTGSISGMVAHSTAGSCLELQSGTAGAGGGMTITNTKIWRANSGSGLTFTSNTPVIGFNSLIFDTFVAFGSSSNILVNTHTSNIVFINATIRAGATFTATRGIEFGARTFFDFIFINSTFGGGGETHSSGDISLTTAGISVNVLLDNCVLSSGTQVNGQSNLIYTNTTAPRSAIRANYLGQTQDHKTWLTYGNWSYDTVAGMFVVSPSLRLTPQSAANKLQSPGFLVGVLSGQSVTASIKVRKSVVGDGAAYNGAQPRWYVRRNYGAGITADTLLDTATAAADGAFETLTGVTAAVSGNCVLEFFVDCDGTTGWVNCDDVSLIAA